MLPLATEIVRRTSTARDALPTAPVRTGPAVRPRPITPVTPVVPARRTPTAWLRHRLARRLHRLALSIEPR